MSLLMLPGETNQEAWLRLGFDPNDTPGMLSHMGAQEVSARSAAWLKTEPLWAPASRMGPYPAWKGVKILGEGGHGTAGKWQMLHEPFPEGHRDKLPFNSVVVKQQAGGHGDMREEVKIYELLRHIPSQHLVTMYRRLYEDEGLGTVRADRRGIVHRIYLEDCELGNFDDMVESRFLGKKHFEEFEVWNAFHCLARALYALHFGHEELNKDRWDRDEIVHFDLKGLNVFVGKPQRDEEHKGAPVMKIGDYGQSREVPNDQDLYYNFQYRWPGTLKYKLPEQLRTRRSNLQRPWMEIGPKSMREAGDGNLLTNLRFGTPSNVWQLGLIMWQMIHCTEWCEGGDESKPYPHMPDLTWAEEGLKPWNIGRPGRFDLKLYPVSNTWLGINDEPGGVHTLATQEDIDYFNGEYENLPPDCYDHESSSEADRFTNRKRIAMENRTRAKLRKSRIYSDELHKLVMDCLIVQQESRIHVEELYKATKKFKDFWATSAGPTAPGPYFPQPPVDLKTLPAPWNDMTMAPGRGLGRPVDEYIESNELGIDHLFYANEEYDRAALIRQWARENPIDNAPELDQREALSVLLRNRQAYLDYTRNVRQYHGQRTRPLYQVPPPFPRGLEHVEGAPGAPGAPGWGGGRERRREGGGFGGGDESERGGGVGEDDRGGPGPGDEDEETPEYLKTMKSTPSDMRRSLSFEKTPPEYEGGAPRSPAGGDLGGFRDMDVDLRNRQRLDQELKSRSSRKSKDGRKPKSKSKSEERDKDWPRFPIGFQRVANESLMARAQEIPELKDTVMFCTVVHKDGHGYSLKGVIYLPGLTPTTTVRRMKEMLMKETGIPLANMTLMGNDLTMTFREFEDDEVRAVMAGLELFLDYIIEG